jgi:hypothetical protein
LNSQLEANRGDRMIQPRRSRRNIMSAEPSDAAPVACALGAGDFRTRIASIADLNRRALRGWRRDDLRLELTYGADAREAVLAMVRGEQGCCAFLDFEVQDEGDAVRVVIRAPERAREASDTVFSPFLSTVPASAGVRAAFLKRVNALP